MFLSEFLYSLAYTLAFFVSIVNTPKERVNLVTVKPSHYWPPKSIVIALVVLIEQGNNTFCDKTIILLFNLIVHSAAKS